MSNLPRPALFRGRPLHLILPLLLSWSQAILGWSQASLAQPTTTQSERTVTERVTTIREREERIVERQKAGNPVKVAIFIKNRAPNVPDDRIAAFEDYMAARMSDDGFRIIRREDALNSVGDFGDDGPNRGDSALPGAKLDQALSNNTSALRLAQALGCEFILNCTISALDSDVSDVDVGGNRIRQANTTLSVTYQLLYASDASGFRGDVIDIKRSSSVTGDRALPKVSADTLLRDAARDLAAAARGAIVARWVPDPLTIPAASEFTVVARAANHEIPEVIRDPNTGDITIGEKARLQVLNVTVELDGIVVGTSPGPIAGAPGLHKMRLRREGFRDWAGTVNLRPGQVFNIDMEMTSETEARLLERAVVFEKMKTHSKLTDAQVKALEGYAQYLQQSGYRIDSRSTSNTDNTSRSTVTTTEKTEKTRREEKVESGPATRP